ncbi:MAG: zinc-dependent metalloprotease, partial [Rubrivivax sp.]
TVVPDPRSLFLGYTYTLAPLPAVPMKARRADQRVGFFTDAYMDLANDGGGDAKRTHIISRWRLEKQDPAAAVSPPKEPIRVVMDRNIPEKWRPAVREGILKWNLAFERAGFKDAVAVEQQPADADWTSLEGTRMLAVRWFAIEGPGATAVGPSQSDPRSGEILRGAAIIPENWVRFFRTQSGDTEPRLPAMPQVASGEFAQRWMQCDYAQDALEQSQFGFELLTARGAFAPEGPEAERYIAQAVVDVTMHEVGHALGLRHNFRGSTGITRAQLRDPAFTKQRGVSNSVMDYNALNMPLEGEAVADYHMTTLGSYDYWAIEYGYKELPPETEAAELAKLAALSDRDPALAYATDEDNFGGVDPLVNQRDLGDEPLAFAQRQVKLSRELWTRTQARQLSATDDMTVYRRNLQRGLNGLAGALPMLGKYLGGNYTSRALAGAQTPVFTPVPAAQQRAALDLLLTEVFASSSFRFDPQFMSRLAVDQMDRTGPNRFVANTDFSLPNAVLNIQRGALDGLMSDALAARLADAEAKVADTKTLLNYADVQARLNGAVWSELKGGKTREIDSLRRNLQREHLRRLAGGLL